MTQTSVDKFRAWLVPVLVTALLGVMGYVAIDKDGQLESQSAEVDALKAEVASLKGSIANVQQVQSDRSLIADTFYKDTASNFKELTGTVNQLALAVNSLVTLQERKR